MRRKTKVMHSALGAAAGLAATYVMTIFQTRAKRLESSISEKEEQNSEENSEPSTVKLADKVSCAVTHHPVPKTQRKRAGNVVHYGFGTFLGALFGILSSKRRPNKTTSGLLFGTAVWAIADNILVPLMGLSKGPFKQSFKTQAYALSSHLVYGGTLASLFRREIRQ